jgi:uncharacterized protein YpuA (DUF1002 family)
VARIAYTLSIKPSYYNLVGFIHHKAVGGETVANKDVSKDVLNVVQKKTGKSVSEKDIQKIASGVKPSTIQSETQLRQLIKQVAGLVNATVSEDTMNEIIRAVKSSKLDPGNMQQLMSMMLGKK